eukprot:101500-Alexandrium_andersonii.AAC.1
MLPNGDWRAINGKVEHYTYGKTYTRAAVLESFQTYLTWALVGVPPSIFQKAKFFGIDATLSWLGLVMRLS